jgi:hypothetical protein
MSPTTLQPRSNSQSSKMSSAPPALRSFAEVSDKSEDEDDIDDNMVDDQTGSPYGLRDQSLERLDGGEELKDMEMGRVKPARNAYRQDGRTNT